MVRYYKKNINTIIRQRWMIIVIMLIFGLVNVNAQSRCCYNVKSKLLSAPARYQLNVTASHVDSRKSNNLFVTAITFPAGYSVLGSPFSPFSKVDCSQTPGTGATPQFECESKDNPIFFVSFELSVQPTPPSNSTLTASAVFIFGDRCQNVAFCTDLADKKDSEGSDKISLGPLGTWPKYAVIIGGVILGLSLLFACYLVYRRNRPGDRYRDTSVTPSSGNYNEKRSVFAPNSLLRSENENDDSPPPIEPPKNTLIQFGSTAERSKSVRGDLSHQTSTKKKKDRKDKKDKKDKRDKKDKNHQEIVIHDHVKSDGEIDGELPMPVSNVVVQIPDNVWEKPSSRRNHDHHASFSTNRIPDHQTFDPSKPVPNHGRESISDHKTELHSSAKRSSSLHHTKSKSGRGGESRRDVKSSNSTSHRSSYPRDDLHRGPSARTRQTDRERDRGDPREEKRRLKESFSNTDPTKKNKGSPSDVPREEKRQRKESFSNIDSTKKNRGSPSDVHRSKTYSSSHQSNKDTGKNNRKSSRTELSHANLNKSKSLNRTRDLMSHADTESTTSSSDIPLGDRLPLAMLTNASRPATKLPSSGQSNSWKPVNNDDDDTTPLGRISSGDAGKTDSFGAASTSSHTRLLGADKLSSENSNQFLNYDINNSFDSVLDQVLYEDYYSIDKHPHEREKGGIASDEEVPIGQLRRE